MIREITLLVLLSSGEVEQTKYDREWPCVTAAAVQNRKGLQAWCLIQTPDEVGKLEKYQD
jgi:hypothetical protein